MPKRTIQQIAILGSGVMGSRIACHFANAGFRVLLLDIAAKETAPKNNIVEEALKAAIASNPAPLFLKQDVSLITTGNFDNDLPKIATCDWIMEVVVENLEIKQQLFERVEKYRKPGTLITSNTSGIPISWMAKGRSDDFQENFCGTHFFNPPRYLPLLEIIPTSKTQAQVVDFLLHFGDLYLGKTTVLCKDTPGFIANRIGVYAIMDVLRLMKKYNFSIEEIDYLTGPIIGHPKSATFRTADVVGLDTLVKVAKGFSQALPNDEEIAVFEVPEYLNKMLENNWLGDKTGQGFFKKTKSTTGEREITALDIETMEYKTANRVKIAALEQIKSNDSLAQRLKNIVALDGREGQFYREMLANLFAYCSNRVPEISDDISRIDDALKAGFGWEMGPFEMWDLFGLGKGLQWIEDSGKKAADWVNVVVARQERPSFYQLNEGKPFEWSINSSEYVKSTGKESFITLNNIRKTSKVWGNDGATLFDLGDGILNLEFHSKMNTMGSEVVQGMAHAVNEAEKNFRGLVIGNQGANFSAGANLALVFMYAIEQEYDEIDMMIRQFQQTIMRVRYSSVPVVVAPHGLTLGGGCELTLHADRVQASAETYIGLVEVGVGLIPGGGGTKEMTLRLSDSFEKGDSELNNLQEMFLTMATGKVATSAKEAFGMKILRRGDQISMNKNRQIKDAKSLALELANTGYVQPAQRKDIKVLGKTGLGFIKAGTYGMLAGQYISEHDLKVAEKLAWVMCGGDLSAPQLVTEQYLLDMEREAFLSLLGEKKTLERIQSIIVKGKPLRN